MTITSTIKDELSKGTSKEEILKKIRSMTKNPNAWTMKSIERVEASLSPKLSPSPKVSTLPEITIVESKPRISDSIKKLKLSEDEETFLSILISNTPMKEEGLELSLNLHLFSFKPTPVFKKLKRKKIIDTFEVGSVNPHLPIVFLTPKYFGELVE